MTAVYKKIEAPAGDEIGMILYAVYVTDPYYEQLHPTAYTARLFAVYDREEVAIAVSNAINNGDIM